MKKSFVTVTLDEGIGNKILSVGCDAYNELMIKKKILLYQEK